jgi:O-acetyl-ADP-ribose deacetylase (regulator of RNase III)
MIYYINGDATQPTVEGIKVIMHCCNDIGKWGKGFVLSISRRWKQPELEFKKASPMKLGDFQLIKVEENIYVANLIGQHGIYPVNGTQPIRYKALENAMSEMIIQAMKLQDLTIHAPRLGCGLAGGDWSEIEKIINNVITPFGIDVYIYNYTKR